MIGVSWRSDYENLGPDGWSQVHPVEIFSIMRCCAVNIQIFVSTLFY